MHTRRTMLRVAAVCILFITFNWPCPSLIDAFAPAHSLGASSRRRYLPQKSQSGEPLSVKYGSEYRIRQSRSELNAKSFPKAPKLEGIESGRLLGILTAFQKDAIQVVEKYVEYCHEHNLPGIALNCGIAGYFHLLVDKPTIQTMLEDRDHIYYRSAVDRAGVGLLTGRGVLLTDGDEHTRKRRLILPSLDTKSLVNFIDIMKTSSENIADQLRGPQKVTKKMTALAMTVVGLALFSADPSDETSIVGDSISRCLEFSAYVARNPLNPPTWVPTRRNRRFRRSMKKLNRLIKAFIADGKARLSSGDQRQNDLLEMLLLACYEDDTEKGLSDRELRDEVMTLFLAGHETTALTLASALWFLSDPKQKEWQHKIVEEYNSIGGTFTLESLQDPEKLKHTRAVLCETLRLHGPSWASDRQIQRKTELPCGYVAKRNQLFIIPTSVMHRDPSVFEEPDEFKPERFLVWGSDPWDGPFSRADYIPFGAGRKRCLGFRFAQWEMLIALSTIISRVVITRSEGQLKPQFFAGITLRPEEDFSLQFESRAATRVETS